MPKMHRERRAERSECMKVQNRRRSGAAVPGTTAGRRSTHMERGKQDLIVSTSQDSRQVEIERLPHRSSTSGSKTQHALISFSSSSDSLFLLHLTGNLNKGAKNGGQRSGSPNVFTEEEKSTLTSLQSLNGASGPPHHQTLLTLHILILSSSLCLFIND